MEKIPYPTLVMLLDINSTHTETIIHEKKSNFEIPYSECQNPKSEAC